eukprot:SAG25_NODE_5773_length_622_cov_0.990440_1_plen_59_part_10
MVGAHGAVPKWRARALRSTSAPGARVDDRQLFGIVYRSTANRPHRGTPIGMARRMPDGP